MPLTGKILLSTVANDASPGLEILYLKYAPVVGFVPLQSMYGLSTFALSSFGASVAVQAEEQTKPFQVRPLGHAIFVTNGGEHGLDFPKVAHFLFD